MRVNLLFGFLGSGKTTLVRRLLDTLSSDVPTAIIVNEFGDVGIDGQILGTGGQINRIGTPAPIYVAVNRVVTADVFHLRERDVVELRYRRAVREDQP